MRDLQEYLVNYDKLPFEDIQISFRRKKVLSILNKYNPNNVLEVGCGYRPLFVEFKSFEKFTIIEPIKKFFSHAKKKASTISNVNVINGLFEESIDSIIDLQFDMIIISSLLHEIKDLNYFLDKLKIICNKETLICVIVPNSNSFHRMLALSMGLINDLDAKSNTQIKLQQNHNFNKKSLCDLFKSKGFITDNVETFFIKPFTHNQMKMMLDNKIIDLSVLEGLYNLSHNLPDYGSELLLLTKLKI